MGKWIGVDAAKITVTAGIPVVVAVAAVAKNKVTKAKTIIIKAATVFVVISGMLLWFPSGVIAQSVDKDTATFGKGPAVDSMHKAVEVPMTSRALSDTLGKSPLGNANNDQDSTAPKPDSTLKRALLPFSLKLPGSKEHTPKGATIRSLILPGWGQAYNHEYWKVPLAVAAVGIPIYLYIDNSKEYNAARQAYNVVFEEMPVISGGKGKLNAAKFAQLEQKFQDAYNSYKKVGGNYVTNYLSTIQSYRNTFRQYRDYSIVAALLGWGLQIADATVFGHLHGFNVTDDISMQVRPVYFQYARIPGIGLSFSLK